MTAPPRALPEEEALLSKDAIPKRLFQFRAGRAAAHAALASLGFAADTPVLRGPHGEPLWPTGTKGSLSHCNMIAAAAVSTSKSLRGIGIDLEDLKRPVRHAVAPYIAHPAELEWINEVPQQRSWRTIILFSAKECVFKAIFPECGIFLGFKDTLFSPPKNGIIQGRLTRSLGKSLPKGFYFDMGLEITHRYVMTYLMI